VQLLVFDLDGTLIDSRRDLAESVNALVVECGGRELPLDSVTAMVGEGAALLVKRALTAAGLDADIAAALPRFLDLYDERLLAHTQPYPGTREALDSLQRRARLAVLTNKPQHHTDRVLRGLGLVEYFEDVIGGDTAHGRKPDPAGLHYLMAQSGSAAETTIMIGDSAIDLRTARAAGVRLCLVRYGFGFASALAELRGDELIASHPSELPDLVQSDVSGRRKG
jgi:phosphoglycolate phosphatase